MAVAMLVTPAAASYLWTESLLKMIFLSAMYGLLSAIAGYYFGLNLDF